MAVMEASVAAGVSRRIEIELPGVADHPVEIESENLEHRLGNRLYLLRNVVLAVERMLEVVDRLGTGSGDDVADRSPLRLARFACGCDVRGRGLGVVADVFAQVLVIDEILIQLTPAHQRTISARYASIG